MAGPCVYASMFERARRYWKPLVALAALEAAGGAVAYRAYADRRQQAPLEVGAEERARAQGWQPPPRQRLLQALRADREWDVLVIGGGATGTGCALDGAVRGLQVACVEAADWASGTSSKSTKLVHGGVRYLEKAVRELDAQQYRLVDEALRERATFLRIAPHLTGQLPIVLPIYRAHLVPYFWLGSKAYDLVAGRAGLHASYFMPRARVLQAFPLLRGDGLAGAMVYYDGVQNDARMNLALALTAIYHGATVTNYTRVVGLLKDADGAGRVSGAVVEDVLTGERWPVRARTVINATGPFCDAIRRMDDPGIAPIVVPSAGTHIVLPAHFGSREHLGVIDPATSDGRVLFFLPWEGRLLAGTTDAPAEISAEPRPTAAEVDFILAEMRKHLAEDVDLGRADVLAAWKGLRPLVKDPSTPKATAALVRSHLIEGNRAGGMITISGGKWTTYRHMAQETIDAAIKHGNLRPTTPRADTAKVPLIGAHAYDPKAYLQLVRTTGLSAAVAQHLASSYGDRAAAVVAGPHENYALLSPDFPYLECEIRWACRHEYAQTATDVLARRLRLAFLSVGAAREALPRVLAVMREELGWSRERTAREQREAESFLVSMGSRLWEDA